MRVEVYETRTGGWRWRAIAQNGTVLARSERTYQRRSQAHNAVESVQRVFNSGNVIEVDRCKK